MKQKTRLLLEDLDKSNVWTITPGDLAQMLINARKKREEFAENEVRYMNVIKLVFDLQYLRRDALDRVNRLESMGYEVFSTPDADGNNAVAIRKHPIRKVTDLTLENIQHLEAWEITDLIGHNMGTGWKGLPLAVQDVIESAFFVDCTILPEKTMRKPGGIIDRRKEDGYKVLEIERGGWIEGIFIKPKPKVEKVHIDYSVEEDDETKARRASQENEELEEEEVLDVNAQENDDEDNFEEEELAQMDEDEVEDEDEPDESDIQIEDIDVIDEIIEEEE